MTTSVSNDKQRSLVFAKGMELLQKKRAKTVSFCGCACGDGGVKGFNEGMLEISIALTNNTLIEQLDLSDIGFSNKSAAQLGAALSTCTNLKRLDLSHNPISDSMMKILSPGLQNLQCLHTLLLNDTHLSDVGLYYLCKTTQPHLPDGQVKILVYQTKYHISPVTKSLLRRGYIRDAHLHYHISAGSFDWLKKFSTTPTNSSAKVKSMQSLHVLHSR